MSARSNLKVYVAGGWKFRQDVQKVMTHFREAGFDIVSGWIERVNNDSSPKSMEHDAVQDIIEVTSADILFVVMDNPEYAYRGSFAEIGCALGQKKPVIIYCPGGFTKKSETEYEYEYYCQINVFFHHKLCTQVLTLEDGIDKLDRAANDKWRVERFIRKNY